MYTQNCTEKPTLPALQGARANQNMSKRVVAITLLTITAITLLGASLALLAPAVVPIGVATLLASAAGALGLSQQAAGITAFCLAVLTGIPIVALAFGRGSQPQTSEDTPVEPPTTNPEMMQSATDSGSQLQTSEDTPVRTSRSQPTNQEMQSATVRESPPQTSEDPPVGTSRPVPGQNTTQNSLGKLLAKRVMQSAVDILFTHYPMMTRWQMGAHCRKGRLQSVALRIVGVGQLGQESAKCMARDCANTILGLLEGIEPADRRALDHHPFTFNDLQIEITLTKNEAGDPPLVPNVRWVQCQEACMTFCIGNQKSSVPMLN